MNMNFLNKEAVLIVIPLFNHAKKLRDVVQKALACSWHVLVVDDGSTDNGLTQVADLPCETLLLPINKGKGAAISAGAIWANKKGYKAIITIDADGQLDPLEAESLLIAAKKNWPSIVVGNRIMDQITVPKSSLFGRKFSNFWVKLESGMNIPDTQSGFRLYPITVILDLPLKCMRYDFEVEVLVRASWAGFKIYSVPVSVDYPEKEERISHFHKLKDNFRLTKLHTKLVIRALSPVPHPKMFHSQEPSLTISLLQPMRLIKEICKEHDSTIQLAVAAWLGIFLGALPLIAVHTVAIIYVAHKLHLNKVAAVTASQLCAPPIVPVLCVQLGFFMQTGQFLTNFTWQTLVIEIPQRFWEYFLGSLVIGPLLGLMVAFLTYLSINKLRQKRESACDRQGI